MRYKCFSEMPVWRMSLGLSKKVFKLTSGLPRVEDYGLSSQLRRSANSISANIAEAYGRRGLKDKSVFYIVSRGSAYEVKSHLLYGETVGYFKEDTVGDLLSGYATIIHELNKILKSFQNQSKNPSQAYSQS